MSSACSTSYNIHEAQHLIPACPFNWCRYPVVAVLLASLAILATASDYLQPSEIYTHRQIRTHTVHADTHIVHTGRFHGYIKAESANFDQLLTVMEWDSGDTEKWWNKVLPSLLLFILIGSRDTISHPLWRNQYSSLVLMHVHLHTSLEWSARRNYEEIRRCSWTCFEIQYVPALPRALIISPLFILFNLECN